LLTWLPALRLDEEIPDSFGAAPGFRSSPQDRPIHFSPKRFGEGKDRGHRW
jgi:hypothetical protein